MKKFLISVVAVDIVAKLAAWHFLYHLPENRIRGSKWKWFWITLIDVVGPIAFLVAGRNPSEDFSEGE
ncbi:hypothetical protein CMUST_08305 [Corynebacterium mustelae]|uniref:Cardiolipin synthase N-terminal domain-containing protein n=1 Tax=Corynebacterium mustelae TaxID=571915 RepID=A0A0G3GZM5_9CORY|nr:hypothetical protein [Corynebacterium mustelae]AKK05985.1 hypothetical protein CMUST_08305 [Corynebacterium mustelae]